MADLSLEKILAFHILTLGKSETEKQNLSLVHDIDYSEFKRRIHGKEKEIELLVIMKALRVLKHLEAYDESLSHVTKEFTSDYLVEFVDGYKCMIEIKHTDKDMFEISGGNLQNRINFAKRHEVPLRFAISIRGFWGLYTSEHLISKSGKITIEDDYLDYSWFDKELATCSYGFMLPTKSESIYIKNKNSGGLGITLSPYGLMTSYKLYSGEKLVLEVNEINKDKNILFLLILIALQDRLASSKPIITKKKDRTKIIERTAQIQFIPEYEFIINCIKRMPPMIGTNSEDNLFASILLDKENIPFAEHLRYTMLELNRKGALLLVRVGKNIYKLDDHAREIWKYSLEDINPPTNNN